MASDSLTNALTEIGRAREDQRAASQWYAIEYRPGVCCIETGPAEAPILVAEDLSLLHASIIVAAVNGMLGRHGLLPLYPSPYVVALLPVTGPDSRD